MSMTLPAGGWALWDLRGLRPMPAPPEPRLGRSEREWSTAWDDERSRAMSEETSGRRRQEPGANEERLEILRLLQAGEITAEEASQLLEALDRSEGLGRGATTGAPGNGGFRRGGSFRLRVSNSATGKANVNLSLPLGLIGAGIAVARRFAPEHVPDAATLHESLVSGLRGKILDVDDDGDRVEIWVE
jgi:hypothetical protein